MRKAKIATKAYKINPWLDLCSILRDLETNKSFVNPIDLSIKKPAEAGFVI